jgi:hypothetical protein
MNITQFKHTGVKKDGSFENKSGAVGTEGGVRMSQSHEDTCDCGCSPDRFISIIMPRTKKGVVLGLTVTFDDAEEMSQFMESGVI